MQNRNKNDDAFAKTSNAVTLNSHPRPAKMAGMRDGDILRSVSEIPEVYRHLFSSFKSFNHVQTLIIDDALYSDKSLVVSAPTGSGKTVIFELAILQLLMHLEDIRHGGDFKIVYTPLKALCHEKLTHWRWCFDRLNVSCEALTGDNFNQDLSSILPHHILITTPEKWDSLSRRWKEYPQIIHAIKLFMIDEVHLLNDDSRGATLETVITRMKTIHKSPEPQNSSAPQSIRFIAASATVPNVDDLATWLGGNGHIKSYKIDDDMRPVKLKKYVLGYSCPPYMSAFRFDISLNYKLCSIIYKYSIGKPILVKELSTRKSTEMAANVLYEQLKLHLSDQQKDILNIASKRLIDVKLKGLMLRGISYHHAGLDLSDREFVEDSFRKGEVPVLLATNTLAMGVNLPAQMVIVKSTETYNQGVVENLSGGAVLQMIGRAGRPQFDTKGMAIILTQQQNVAKYENLVHGSAVLESHLHQHMTEHLNSEIVLRTITDLKVAMHWIKSSFLYVRAIKNPINYGLTEGMSKENIENKLQEMCLTDINTLETHNLIKKDPTNGMAVECTPYGRLMARFFLSLQTMKLFQKVQGKESLKDLFNIIVSCNEFSQFNLRTSDKKTLNELNEVTDQFSLRYRINGKIQTVAQKTSCLLQAVLGNLPIADSSLSQESVKMMRLAEKISQCLLEYVRVSDEMYGSGNLLTTVSAVTLAKCCKAHLWDNSEYVSKQFPKIGPVYSRLLAAKDKTSIGALLATDPREIEQILNKAPPFGNDIIDAVSLLPIYEIHATHDAPYSVSLKVTQNNSNFIPAPKSTDAVVLVVGDSHNKVLLFNSNVSFILSEYKSFKRTVKFRMDSTIELRFYLIHQSVVGIDQYVVIPINNSRTALEPSVNLTNATRINVAPPKKVRIFDYFPSCNMDRATAKRKRNSPINSGFSDSSTESTTKQTSVTFDESIFQPRDRFSEKAIENEKPADISYPELLNFNFYKKQQLRNNYQSNATMQPQTLKWPTDRHISSPHLTNPQCSTMHLQWPATSFQTAVQKQPTTQLKNLQSYTSDRQTSFETKPTSQIENLQWPATDRQTSVQNLLTNQKCSVADRETAVLKEPASLLPNFQWEITDLRIPARKEPTPYMQNLHWPFNHLQKHFQPAKHLELREQATDHINVQEPGTDHESTDKFPFLHLQNQWAQTANATQRVCQLPITDCANSGQKEQTQITKNIQWPLNNHKTFAQKESDDNAQLITIDPQTYLQTALANGQNKSHWPAIDSQNSVTKRPVTLPQYQQVASANAHQRAFQLPQNSNPKKNFDIGIEELLNITPPTETTISKDQLTEPLFFKQDNPVIEQSIHSPSTNNIPGRQFDFYQFSNKYRADNDPNINADFDESLCMVHCHPESIKLPANSLPRTNEASNRRAVELQSFSSSNAYNPNTSNSIPADTSRFGSMERSDFGIFKFSVEQHSLQSTENVSSVEDQRNVMPKDYKYGTNESTNRINQLLKNINPD